MILIFAVAAVFASDLCIATKRDGTACRNKATEGTTYCLIHNPDAPRCGFIKKDGQPCRIRVTEAGQLCHHHRTKD